MKPRIRKWMLLASVALFLYATGYGIARWRKFVVMRQSWLKEEGLVVRRTGPGVDIRENWKGRFKNSVNPALFLLFRPAELFEDCVRGGITPIPSNHAASDNGAMAFLFHAGHSARAVHERARSI